MKNPYRTTLAIIAMASMIVGAAHAATLNIEGGYVNTKHSKLVAVQKVTSTQYLMMRLGIEEPLVAGVVGKLYKVMPNKAFSQLRATFVDARRVSIALPKDSRNKIVIVDSRNYIVGAVGLTSAEMTLLMGAYPETFGKASRLYGQFSNARSASYFFAGVRDAARSLEGQTRMSLDEKEATFVSSVGMLSGTTAQDIAQDIVDVAAANDYAPLSSINTTLKTSFTAETARETILSGIDLVAEEGTNGGGGLVAEEGTNGGGGLVAEEGTNGGGGLVETIGQGWDSAVSFADPIPAALVPMINGQMFLLI